MKRDWLGIGLFDFFVSSWSSFGINSSSTLYLSLAIKVKLPSLLILKNSRIHHLPTTVLASHKASNVSIGHNGLLTTKKVSLSPTERLSCHPS